MLIDCIHIDSLVDNSYTNKIIEEIYYSSENMKEIMFFSFFKGTVPSDLIEIYECRIMNSREGHFKYFSDYDEYLNFRKKYKFAIMYSERYFFFKNGRFKKIIDSNAEEVRVDGALEYHDSSEFGFYVKVDDEIHLFYLFSDNFYYPNKIDYNVKMEKFENANEYIIKVDSLKKTTLYSLNKISFNLQKICTYSVNLL